MNYIYTLIFIPIAIFAGGAIYLIRYLYYKVKLNLIHKLEYKREFTVTGAFEDEEVILIETIYNNSMLPIFFVDIEFYIYSNLKLIDEDSMVVEKKDSPMQLVTSRFHLMPYMQIKRRHEIKCKRRGFYKLETISIYIKKDTVFIQSETDIHVYPKIIEIKYTSFPINYIQGNNISLSRVISDPFSISGVRDYQNGDPFNLINFKATAKNYLQGIKVNKLDYCATRIFMIYINFQTPHEISVPTNLYESLMEQALSFAASFISEALRNGYKIGLSANCTLITGETQITFPMVSGLYHIEEILKEIAKAQLKSGVSFTSLLHAGINENIRDSEIFIMSMYSDETIDESMRMLKKFNNTVNLIILD